MLQGLFKQHGFLVRDHVNPFKGNQQKISLGSAEELERLGEKVVEEKERTMSKEPVDFMIVDWVCFLDR